MSREVSWYDFSAMSLIVVVRWPTDVHSDAF